MIERLSVFLALLMLLALPAQAQDVTEVPVGFVELAEDARYADDAAQAGISFRTMGRPRVGAELGVADGNAVGRLMGLEFRLRVASGAMDDLIAATRKMAASGVGFVLADLPADRLTEFADAVSDLPLLILNVSARADRLRGAECRPNLAHTIPSDAMRADALVQYLVARNWRDILLLVGPSPRDAAFADAMERAAAKFGARIEARQSFDLTTDPRRRTESNVALLSGGSGADVVFVADAGGEFGRYVPYRTVDPMPVVGSAGLTPTAWHWSWDRYGAPQVQHRLEALAPPRRMNAAAWAAWVAVKAVTQAAIRTDPADSAAMRDYLLGPELNLDGSKGYAMSFRPWNRQLRQPVLLATPNAVIAAAPFEAFLHRSNDLDTLGIDEAESGCRR